MSNAAGLSTGVGREAVEEGLRASQQGGKAAQAFTEGLRGRVSPEDLVQSARGALDEVVATRNQNYRAMLEKLSDDASTYDISPIVKEIDNQLSKFKILKNEDGTLDFSRSAIRFNKAAQNDINTIFDEMKGFGLKQGDRTAVGVDSLKRALQSLDKPSSDVRAFTTAVSGKARKVLDNAPGYTDAMREYAKLSDDIEDIQRNLSLGDKAMVETSFKKLTNSLKGNDARSEILRELDAATGGTLVPKIAGQRLSEMTPRGLTGITSLGAGTLLAGLGGQGGLLAVLGMVMTQSPRLVGEYIRALGLTARQTEKLLQVLERFRPQITGAGLVTRNYNAE